MEQSNKWIPQISGRLLMIPLIGFMAACEFKPPPVGAIELIRANEIADCPEGQVLAGYLPHFYCTLPELFVGLHGNEVYDYVYGEN